jgi:diguanylate cyclase
MSRSDQQRVSVQAIADGGRLAALRDLAILDTDPEPAFDRFTRLAADLLKAPISLVTLIDRDRQFFKSECGLPDLWSAVRETPLSHSLCQHVVGSGRQVVIDDAREDARVAGNLAVRDLSVIAYAGFPLMLEDGHVVGALCASIDTLPRAWKAQELRILEDLAAAVTSLLELRRSVTHPALHDRLTGLPNREFTVAYAERVSAVLGEGELLAVAVGIDDLSAVNATYGTQVGDRVITTVARRVGEMIGSEDLLGRLEGDVFIVIRPRVQNQREAIEFAYRIREAVCAEPMRVSGEPLPVSATVGIATGTRDVPGATVIDRSVQLMRRAKGLLGRAASGEPGHGHSSATELRLREALHGAVGREEITVAFQPIVELTDGRTHGFEALARWRHPELGAIVPGDFIPVAESSGEIVLIGEHVLRTACRQLARWRAQSGEDLRMTVNLSPVQLSLPNLPEVIEAILRRFALPGSALALELTEGVFTAPGALERRNLEQIRELGVQIALDDFGTGYSALSYLKRFPVDVIKVDRCFLDGLETDRRDAALMRAILAIGSGMDIQVVAEGVETPAQRDLLRRSGCHWGQGYLFARPLPAEEISVGR